MYTVTIYSCCPGISEYAKGHLLPTLDLRCSTQTCHRYNQPLFRSRQVIISRPAAV